MANVPVVPGVYFESRPRQPGAPFARTDVAGFIGFEPRIVDGRRASRLTGGSTPSGHEFVVELAGFQVELDGVRASLPEVPNLCLSSHPNSIPIADGQSIVYTLVAAGTGGSTLHVVVVEGSPHPTGHHGAPSDEDVERAVPVVTDGSSPCRLTGGPPATGHEFQLDLRTFDVEIGGRPVRVPAATNLVLSSAPASIPIRDGESLAYALVATVVDEAPRWIVVTGSAAPSGNEQAPSNERIRAAVARKVGKRPWVRIADVRIAREDQTVALRVDDPRWIRLADVAVSRQGAHVRTTVIPRLPPSRLDDWNDFLKAFGTPREDGTFLGAGVRAYFANGGRRCYVTTVTRPDFRDADGLEAARLEMVGVRGASENEATGFERLLLIPEVSFVDVPDLYAGSDVLIRRTFPLPKTEEEARFRSCGKMVLGSVEAEAQGENARLEPLYDDDQVRDAQFRLLRRGIDERWRVLLLLTPPMELDPAAGRFRGPSVIKAKRWREGFANLGEDPDKMSCAAIYFPWVLSQQRTDTSVVEMPPTSFVAGVIARRDLTRGVHVSPANETLRGVVGLTRPVDDQTNGELYEPPSNVNALRAFPGWGVQLWGARTLSSDKWLRYVSVRRCLSAIERRAVAALEPLVFEPNSALLWLQITQQMLGVLLPIYESGALRGSRPEEAFYVRCDSSVNPPDQIENGLLVCEVGVAVAAPAEFIVFRLGRREGVVEVME